MRPKRFGIEEGSERFNAALVMVAAVYVGSSDLNRRAALTGISRAEVEQVAQRLRHLGI
jgi:hypothetical protein